MKEYFKYRFSNDFEINLNEKDFVTIIGNNNNLIMHSLIHRQKRCNIFIGDKEYNPNQKELYYKQIGFILYKHLNLYVGETVIDELVYGLENMSKSRNEIREIIDIKSKLFKINHLLDRDVNSLGNSDRVKMKIMSIIITEPKVLVIDNILNELDLNDKLLVLEILEEYAKKGNIVINITNDIEETLYTNKMIIINDKKNVFSGKPSKILENEKLLKDLKIGLPFMYELSKYLIDYGMIDKYYLTNKSLVEAIWK